MKIEPFKMKVTSDQSVIVQEILFTHGIVWSGRKADLIVSAGTSYLFLGYYRCDELNYCTDEFTFRDCSLKEITFEEFKKLYMKTLQITAERVLEAANKCSQANEVLRTLFPDAFEDEKYFDLTKLVRVDDDEYIFTRNSSIDAGFDDNCFFYKRQVGRYADKSFVLNDYYNWEIVKDDIGDLCLVPTKIRF